MCFTKSKKLSTGGVQSASPKPSPLPIARPVSCPTRTITPTEQAAGVSAPLGLKRQSSTSTLPPSGAPPKNPPPATIPVTSHTATGSIPAGPLPPHPHNFPPASVSDPSLSTSPSLYQCPAAPQNHVVQSATSLWQEALAKLKPEERDAIDPNQDISHVLRDLLEAAEQKKKVCENKQWSYTTRDGNKRLVRDSVSTCLTNLTKFIPVGDAALGALPMIASAPWGAFKFLLTTVTSGVENTRIIFESLENLSRIMSHCTIYEALYLESAGLDASPLLQGSLLNLYVSILHYLCYAGKHFDRNSAAQYAQGIGEAIWKGLDECLKLVSAGEGCVKEAADLAAKEDQSKRLVELVGRLEEVMELRHPIGRIEARVDDIFTILQGDERSEILGWLSRISFKEHHHNIRHARHPETGKWLLSKDCFLGWKAPGSTSLFWLHGIAGSGKTMLASQIIDLMKPEYNEYSLAYFYCNYKESSRRDPASILRSIIKQLCLRSPTGSLPQPLLAIYRKRKEESDLRPLDVREIKDLLVEFSKGLLQTTIVIDALDECDRETREILLDVLDDVISLAKNPIKIFATSRDDGDLRARLEESPNVYIQEGENSGDITLYINSEIETCITRRKLLRGEVGEDLKKKIVDTLRENAHGMFIWVRYQIERICKEKTHDGVLTALTELPKTLNDTYTEILERINADESRRNVNMANKVLRWILYAVRPLSAPELIEAISVTPMTSGFNITGLTQTAILDICQNLVVFDEKIQVFRFAHFSVQEFLLLKFEPEKSHTTVAEACLTLLTYHHLELYSKASALLDYSTSNWALHVRSSGSGSGCLKDLWTEFLKPSIAYDSWVTRISEEQRDLRPIQSESLSPLLVTCYYQLPYILKYLLDEGADLDCTNSDGKKSLHLGAQHGHEKVVQILLEKGADVGSKDKYGQTPLSWAAMRGHEKVVQMLLERGVDVESKDTDYGQTPLSWAAEKGHEKVVQMLLEKGADVENKDTSFGRTPLSWAAEKGHEKVVQMLLEKGADVESKDKIFGQTPLSWATREGHEKVVQILLEKGTDVENKDTSFGRTPLLWATREGHEKVVQMLLEKGADVENKDTSFGRTPLLWATREGHEKVVQMLLEKGADVENKDTKYGQTPLSWAAEKGHEKVVQMLLEKGADVESKDTSFGRTPLSWAAEKGHEKVVQMLLEKGADVESKDTSFGRKPLSWAAREGHEKVVQLLRNETVK